MKITLLLPEIGFAGGIKVIAIHADNLQKKGHEVTLIGVPRRKPTLRERLRDFKKGKGWLDYNSVPTSHLDEYKFDYRRLDKFRPIEDKDVPDADIVIATWWETAEWAINLSPSKGIKVHFIQGHELFDPCAYERVKNVYKYPFHKIVVSNWLKSIIETEYKCQSPDLVSNTVDVDLFKTKKRTKQKIPTFGFIYSYVKIKNSALCIDTINRLKQKYPEIKVICFSSNLQDPNLKLPAWVEFHHLPTKSKITEIYASCDAWLFSSTEEGFGLPILEAMASRTPVIGTRAGAAEQFIDETTGALVSPTIDDFEKEMIRFIDMKNKEWQTLSDNAYNRVSNYNWEDATDLFEKSLINFSKTKSDKNDNA